MFKSAFKSALRPGVFSRGLATARTTRSTTYTKTAVGATLVLSSLVFFPIATISNDANKEKVKKDQNEAVKSAEEKVEAEKKEPSTSAASEESETQPEEEEGGQSAAYNPETGEINWDCPCLGGMAHGPCGEEFKAAFSCFVYSETEPKGIDCIEKFEAMRTCFKQHPEHYKEELYEDDEPVPSTDNETETAAGKASEPREIDIIEEVAEEFVDDTIVYEQPSEAATSKEA
ncbi:putative mitochondrial intermembrane space import and assembly protein [Clavispora lusitaniae]|uniref:Mitochondrial intermembrane space import and assembly protein n=1 Tax=Clavispora lusitaniae TaxID=36911 RepID=A0ACD0WNR0_CLALS|nr:Oxidoreductase [Clavispora lusitaniae]QFZ29149.1 putative mitochondrial intermembrane space import and assembly protein [Clavispora lusitaniae]QFZ34812.1 putative mitochondrial intermembrane space import and assembly protein [Clavispora lusitaniae]QFZ40497.1 putative mitochondrial intermembrane space import and assembly protein [Clavispora lusitaniae]QFZ46177.1 putative mitochondrial intermembrane space import and assembly protein [Clavispora lusitaniae]